MAVVRIQPTAAFHDSPALRIATAEALAAIAREPGLRAFQVDFDATESQRAFYSAVLQQLRARMPPSMPLSITALLSWCGPHSWLDALPIDEAVPMYFRLGAAASPTADKTGYKIRQPLCRTSAGVSSDESWPVVNPDSRLYVFAPQPWTETQLAVMNSTPRTPKISLHQELER